MSRVGFNLKREVFLPQTERAHLRFVSGVRCSRQLGCLSGAWERDVVSFEHVPL